MIADRVHDHNQVSATDVTHKEITTDIITRIAEKMDFIKHAMIFEQDTSLDIKRSRVFSSDPGIEVEDFKNFDFAKKGDEENIRLDNGRSIYFVNLIDRRFNKVWLIFETPPDYLTTRNILIMDILASELGLWWLGRYDPGEQKRRMLEYRHALRGGVNAISANLAEANNVYRFFKDESTDEQKVEILNEARFRRLLGRSEMAATKMRVYLEDLRISMLYLNKHELNPVRIDINKIVNYIITIYRHEIDRVHLEISNVSNYPDIGEILPIADENLIELAILNLVENAVKYSNSGTEIEIDYGYIPRKKWYFSIVNTGKYIPESVQLRMKQMFARGVGEGEENLQAGTGLGLASVRRILFAHDSLCSFDISSSPLDTPDVDEAEIGRSVFRFELRFMEEKYK